MVLGHPFPAPHNVPCLFLCLRYALTLHNLSRHMKVVIFILILGVWETWYNLHCFIVMSLPYHPQLGHQVCTRHRYYLCMFIQLGMSRHRHLLLRVFFGANDLYQIFIGSHNVKMSVFLYVCAVTFSRPLIGQKRECYIVEEVIEVDELSKGNISAALGKQDE